MSTQRRVGVTRHPDRLAQILRARCPLSQLRGEIDLLGSEGLQGKKVDNTKPQRSFRFPRWSW